MKDALAVANWHFPTRWENTLDNSSYVSKLHINYEESQLLAIATPHDFTEF
jgi:hypothetical protein